MIQRLKKGRVVSLLSVDWDAHYVQNVDKNILV